MEKILYIETQEEALQINQRVVDACMSESFWSNGTNNYCVPYLDENTGKWIVPILEGYEQFFTPFELSIANQIMEPATMQVLKDQSFCNGIKLKLLTMQRGVVTDPLVFRQMSDLFFYAKDAADNGSPRQLKYELQQLSDSLPLTNWASIKASLIAEIDAYINN